MFQDEKTTELDLSSVYPTQQTGSKSPRWTEKQTRTHQAPPSANSNAASAKLSLDETHLPWLLKLAAAVSILLLSTWLL